MRLEPDPQPITEDDDTIRRALEDVAVVPLVAAVARLTGDRSLLRDDLRPDPTRLLEPDAGIDPAAMAAGRDAAAAALARHRDAGCPAPAPPTDEEVRELIEFVTGSSGDVHLPLLREELAIAGEDLRAPGWRKEEIAPDREVRVVVVGAGMSGLLVAHRLRQAGVDVTIFEKNADVGGTWYENRYPGCRVDIANHVYSYSFAQTSDWPQFYSTQDVLLDYFRTCADALGIRPHIRFEHEVVSAALDDESQVWTLTVRTPDGALAEHTAHAVVSAVGQLNRPSFPDIPGRDRFAGEWFHSARWDPDVELRAKRVAVIGTGASAVQFIPTVAEQASELTVFQRTPPWLIPAPNNQDDLPAGFRWALDHIAELEHWDRLWLFWRTHEALLPMAAVDPDWPDHEHSVSALNDMVRQLFTGYLQLEFPEPELLEKVLPTYPPIAKRIVLDNGTWSRTLHRDDVELVTTPIQEITEKGVRTADGVEHVVDVLIYGTGFQASRFLTPMTVRGTGGADLHEVWDGDARAYLGITVPGFPNLFLCYGPNTNIVINGSIVYFSECEAHFIVQALRFLLERELRSIDPKPDVHEAYNERIDAGNRAMAWGASSVNSWYKNAKGRVAQNWPFSLLEYWQQTRDVDPDDYVLR